MGCMGCQCGWASARYHDAQQQGLPPVGVSYNYPGGPVGPRGPEPPGYTIYPPQQGHGPAPPGYSIFAPQKPPPQGGQWQPPPSQPGATSATAPLQTHYGYP